VTTRLLRLAASVAAIFAVAGSAAGAATATPVEGEWGGRTSDDLSVSFQVHAGVIENVRFTFTWGFCGSFESALPNTEPIGADGSWAYLDGRGPEIEGAFLAAEEASGTVTAPSRELPSCPRTEATFSAAPGPVPPPLPILIAGCGGPPIRRPARICPAIRRPTAPRVFYDLRWLRIGLQKARARGYALIVKGGRRLRPRASIELMRGADEETSGYRTFEEVGYVLRGRLPAGIPRSGQIRMR
jgi:hypothetical protein